MWKELIYSLRMLAVMTVMLGVIYPVVMTSFAQVVFDEEANGSLVRRQGGVVGSSLIGQSFSGERYFHGRPSHAGENGYDAAGSAGSNLGPTNAELMKRIGERAAKIREENGLAASASVPSDLVTASGSGLDPHITPQAAYVQAERIATARRLEKEKVFVLIEENTEYAVAGFLGGERVNVLMLNLALDKAE